MIFYKKIEKVFLRIIFLSIFNSELRALFQKGFNFSASSLIQTKKTTYAKKTTGFSHR